MKIEVRYAGGLESASGALKWHRFRVNGPGAGGHSIVRLILMTYKGVYRDGIVIIQGDVDFRNGAVVDVNLRGRRKSAKKKSSGKAEANQMTPAQIAGLFKDNAWDSIRRTKMTKKQRMATLLAARGTWKDRPEWNGKSSAQVAAELRTKASRRGRDG